MWDFNKKKDEDSETESTFDHQSFKQYEDPAVKDNGPRDGYVAMTGLSFDHYGVRIRKGEKIPSELLQDDFIFDWLLNKRRAIKKL